MKLFLVSLLIAPAYMRKAKGTQVRADFSIRFKRHIEYCRWRLLAHRKMHRFWLARLRSRCRRYHFAFTYIFLALMQGRYRRDFGQYSLHYATN